MKIPLQLVRITTSILSMTFFILGLVVAVVFFFQVLDAYVFSSENGCKLGSIYEAMILKLFFSISLASAFLGGGGVLFGSTASYFDVRKSSDVGFVKTHYVKILLYSVWGFLGLFISGGLLMYVATLCPG